MTNAIYTIGPCNPQGPAAWQLVVGLAGGAGIAFGSPILAWSLAG